MLTGTPVPNMPFTVCRISGQAVVHFFVPQFPLGAPVLPRPRPPPDPSGPACSQPVSALELRAWLSAM